MTPDPDDHPRPTQLPVEPKRTLEIVIGWPNGEVMSVDEKYAKQFQINIPGVGTGYHIGEDKQGRWIYRSARADQK